MLDHQDRSGPSAPSAGADALAAARAAIRAHTRAPEDALVRQLIDEAALSEADRQAIGARAVELVRHLREDGDPGLMEVMLAEYGLSTEEGLALMCLAEALLRVPDAETVDALIEDKIGPGEWMRHFGHSPSVLVNASTLGLALTGRVLSRDEAGNLIGGAVRRLGEPVIRTAVSRAMREMGRQFVLGQTIEEAAKRAASLEARNFTHSYDMLGEAAMTAADARHFYDAYDHAIAVLAKRAQSPRPRDNPGISIKLSALHPRYETAKRERVMAELVPRVETLARAAKAANMGLNIDAEEMDRLDLSLDVIEAVLSDDALADWDGFGVVVQAYGKRATFVVDWLVELAAQHHRRIMVRLVKGAYWDTEIKRAQVDGLDGFPVFTRKAATDVTYIAVARKLLDHAGRIYPQFATHNAHSVAAILAMARQMGVDKATFEFQRLHGMGAALHEHLAATEGTRCRIYAPVGRHRELLAYLVRRLLENGANSSFVNQVMDTNVPAERVVADPFESATEPARGVTAPKDLFEPRRNSLGFGLKEPGDVAAIEAAREPFRTSTWQAAPILAVEPSDAPAQDVRNPYHRDDVVGTVTDAVAEDVAGAAEAARPWQTSAAERAATLNAVADAYEANFGELFAILAREAGKALPDAVAELREAVDFLRFYAAEAERLEANGARDPAGIVAAISPWNFPLAIFTGQIAAGLAAGNAVLAKPAEPSPLIAFRAVQLMHEAGVPRTAIQLVPGPGGVVGKALTEHPGVKGVCFTGSTATARAIHRSIADALDPAAPLIAETGGLNAMIVDSTALPEQAVRDIIASAFQSAGQRCSACRILYLQEDVADEITTMLFGAMDELTVGDPWPIATDIGPVINAAAFDDFQGYVAAAKREGRLMKHVEPEDRGFAFGPAVIRIAGIAALEREVFGPILHLATFKAGELEAVIDAINARGYGLTFGLHTRLTDRAEHVARRIEAGNIYVNRNQIGAIVGSQPFGGERLSGTGPKAGGPRYLPRFYRAAGPARASGAGPTIDADRLQAAIDSMPPPATAPLERRDLPGPTGESNVYTTYARGLVLCAGPTAQDAAEAAGIVEANGGRAIQIAPGAPGKGALDGTLDPAALEMVRGIAAVACFGDAATARPLRQALARRDGPIVPLAVSAEALRQIAVVERHVCTDTTAAGGNANLMMQSAGA